MRATDCFREIEERLSALTMNCDPAPWFAAGPGALPGDNLTPNIRPAAIRERARCVFFRAMLDGTLKSWLVDRKERFAIPGWAWDYHNGDLGFLYSGKLFFHPLMPDAYQRWTRCSVEVEDASFNAWLATEEAVDQTGFPELPRPFDALSTPQLISAQEPLATTYVSLCHAVSWIAWGISLDSDRLFDALNGAWKANLEEVQTELALAVTQLCERASSGQIRMLGKYDDDSGNENTALTEPIAPHRLLDFARFDMLGDSLRHGSGLLWIYGDSYLERAIPTGRRDKYRMVSVSRDDLMRFFPASADHAQALLLPLPATLPGIGLVMGMEEGLCLTAHGTPSYDAAVWQRPNGSLFFTDPDGNEIRTSEASEMAPQMIAYLKASRAIHAALRDGALASYVMPQDGQPLRISRLYWNPVNPELLDHVYRGMSAGNVGAGCPVLFSQLEFDGWRASQKGDVEADKVELKYSNQEILEWIDASAFTDVKKARTAFMQEPRASGLSGTFENVWNLKFKRGKGRPPAEKT